MVDLDCGDNSCRFAKVRGGMRTNGGCGCFEKAGYSRSAIKSAEQMLLDVLALRARVKELEEMVIAYRVANEGRAHRDGCTLMENEKLREALEKLAKGNRSPGVLAIAREALK